MPTVLKVPAINPAVRLVVVVEPDGAQFHAYSPALKGLHVDGKTPLEALARAQRAALLYLDSLARHHENLPEVEDVVFPQGADIHLVTLEWPSSKMPGTR